jgi:hypothetical protein
LVNKRSDYTALALQSESEVPGGQSPGRLILHRRIKVWRVVIMMTPYVIIIIITIFVKEIGIVGFLEQLG